MRARDEVRPRLVEADVAVRAEAENLQVDAARPLDGPLVLRAFGREIAGRSVQEMDAARRHVDAAEEMRLHERAIAGRIMSLEADEFVQVERRYAREVDRFARGKASEVAVERNGCAAGWQPQHEPRPARDRGGDRTGERA